MQNVLRGKTSKSGQQLFTVRCSLCDELNPSHCRRQCIHQSDYYLCPSCDVNELKKLIGFDPIQQVMVENLYAAPSGWRGLVVQKAEAKDRLAVRRARNILARGLSMVSPDPLPECRAMRRIMKGSHTNAEWEALKDKYNHACLCCGKEEPEVKLVQDHVIPVMQGGTDHIENIQPLCSTCNGKKKDRVRDYRY